MDEFIPISFRNHFYASTGRSRKYPLHAFLWALLIQRIFSIPKDQVLLTFLAYSKPLREFCGFTKVPNVSKITRFKQDFLDDLQLVFYNLVDVTDPIYQGIDSAKADMTIFDSSEIKAFVIENNPKYANRIIRRLKAYTKAQGFNKSYDPYKAAYASMPLMLLRILRSNSCILMDIFAISSSLALLPMGAVSFVIFPFTIRIFE